MTVHTFTQAEILAMLPDDLLELVRYRAPVYDDMLKMTVIGAIFEKLGGFPGDGSDLCFDLDASREEASEKISAFLGSKWLGGVVNHVIKPCTHTRRNHHTGAKLTRSEMIGVDRFRKANGIESRSEAIGLLVAEGLKALQKTSDADG